MVEISEITTEATIVTIGTQPEKIEEPPQDPAEPPAANTADSVEPPVEDAAEMDEPQAKTPAEGGKTVYNDYALRVANIMRSYLSVRPGESEVGGSGDCGGGDRCKAMMEVMRMENGRWSVSKVILEHSHPTSSSVDETAGEILPAVGMDFESISMAKAFYVAYSEKMGFKAKTGLGRRSKGTRMLVMQKFFCSKGNYLVSGEAGDEVGVKKKKRGPYRKRVSKKDGEDVEVIQVESSDERVGDAGSGSQEGDGVLGEKDVGVVPSQSQVGGGSGKEKVSGGTPAQSRLLRELGVRVSKYTNEERRDIILKYMKKRNSRQVVDRSIKVIF